MLLDVLVNIEPGLVCGEDKQQFLYFLSNVFGLKCLKTTNSKVPLTYLMEITKHTDVCTLRQNKNL